MREANETVATNRARALAAAALDGATFDRLCAAGAKLRDAEIRAIAFATVDD